MRALCYIFLCFILLFGATHGFSQSRYKKYEGKIIYDIRFKGLINTNKDLVIGRMTIKKGAKFSYKKLITNFRDIEELNFFEKITVQVDKKGANQVIITFIFVELPKVGAIAIEGENEIEEKDIINVMTLKPGIVYKDSDLAKDEKNIFRLYRQRGFEGTTIQIRKRSGGNKKLVNIIVQVQEGKEVYLESVKIIGTKTIDPDDLYDKMLSKESTLLRGGQILDSRKLAFDRYIIEKYLKDHGHWLGRVKSIRKKKDFLHPEDPDDQTKGFFILIEIEEGPIFKMGKVTITGHKVFKNKDLYPLIKSKEGDIFNYSKLKKDLNEIKKLYTKRGYIQLQIIPTPIVDEKNLIINWNIELIEGEKVHIEQIRIIGHEKTKIWVIDRELRIFEGEIYNSEKITRSKQKILNTQLFSRADPVTEPGSDDGLINLFFRVNEQRTGLITVGAGFGTLRGFSVFEEVTEKNFMGTGWALRERVEVGQRRTNLELGASTRWLFPYVPISFNFTFRFLRDLVNASFSLDPGFVQSNVFYTYVFKAIEVDIAFGYQVSENWSIFTGFLVSFSKANDPSNFALNNVDSTTIRGRSLAADLQAGLTGNFLVKLSQRLGFVYDTRDFTLNPRNGWQITGIFHYTGGVYGGDSQWIRLENRYAFYINPVWDLVFASFANFIVNSKQFDGNFQIRDVDRLRFDGLNELRGWRTFTRDEVVGRGGKISLIQEIRFPLFEEILWGVLFADAGNVTDTLGTLPPSLHFYSFGFGFRVQIPLIPIRLYFAKRADFNVTTPNRFVFRNGMDVVFTVGGFF